MKDTPFNNIDLSNFEVFIDFMNQSDRGRDAQGVGLAD